MKITNDMVPRLPNGALDADSWTYRAISAQGEWYRKVAVQDDSFYKLVLTPMIRGLFNDSEYISPPDDETELSSGPPQYQQGCDVLARKTGVLNLNWQFLSDRTRQKDYAQLRRLLDRRRFYQELFRCKAGGFSVAWRRLVASTGMTAEDARASSDLKTWFALHLIIGPEVDVSSLRDPRLRSTRTRRDTGGVNLRTSVSLPSATAALAGVMALMIEELEGKTNAEVEWCLREMNDVLQRFRERNEPPEVEGQVPAEPVRFLDPEYVVDFDQSGTEPPKE